MAAVGKAINYFTRLTNPEMNVLMRIRFDELNPRQIIRGQTCTLCGAKMEKNHIMACAANANLRTIRHDRFLEVI